jgi:hypothetical protein
MQGYACVYGLANRVIVFIKLVLKDIAVFIFRAVGIGVINF